MVMYFFEAKNNKFETRFQFTDENEDCVIEIVIPGNIPREEYAILEKHMIKSHPRAWIN